MFTLRMPTTYKQEREYIADVLLGEFLGLDYQIEFQPRQDVDIRTGDGKGLAVADVLFQVPEAQWLTPGSLPRQPLRCWNTAATPLDCPLAHPNLPIIYGREPRFSNSADAFNPLTIDVFGSAFFMLSRLEEVVRPDRDRHGRFPLHASLAFQERFAHRPIINEYVELLWWCLKRLWPGLRRKERAFRILPTHDVDQPFDLMPTTADRLFRRLCGDLVKRKDPRLAVKRLQQQLGVGKGGGPDEFDTFQWLMEQSESIGAKSGFYFKANSVNRKFDPHYRLDKPLVKRRMKQIEERGHEIGFHPGYYTPGNRREWLKEWTNFKSHCHDIDVRGGRQHFLRFEVPLTWRFWEEAGLEYDSTLAFADRAGFRCGVCYEYPVFDLIERRKMKLKERPLIFMEKTLLKGRDRCTDNDGDLDYGKNLREAVRSFNGDFTILWHNNKLFNEKTRGSYLALIR